MAFDLSSVITGVNVKPPLIGLYGPQGIGKTTFGANAPKSITIPTEEGEGVLDLARFPICKTFEDVMGCISTLCTEDHGFTTVILDTLDSFEPMVWQATANEHGKKSIEDFGYGKGYIFALDQWRQVLTALKWLRNEKNMTVILTCHEHVKRYESPDVDPFDRYELRVHKTTQAVVTDWLDCLLFANYRVNLKKTEGGFNKTHTRGVGKGERVLYTEERPAFRAKNRYGLPPEMSFSWKAFDEAFMAAMPGATTPQAEPTTEPTNTKEEE